MSNPPAHHLRRFRFNPPQRIAALMLLMFTVQVCAIIASAPPTQRDTLYATCGSQTWAAFSPPRIPSSLCPKADDGALAYRAAGLPLAVHNWLDGQPANARPKNLFLTLSSLALWIRLPFLLAGIALGGCLWWVTRRLFGNPGGYLALGLYCFSPAVILNSALPNNSILAAFGLFAAIYTAIGVAHAMQGPRSRWRKRILLLTATLGFTAAASIPAFLVALVIGSGLLIWLAEDRRKYAPTITLTSTAGAILIFFAASGFQPAAFGAFLHILPANPPSTRLPQFVLSWNTVPIRIALVIALIGYAVLRPARYFGNTTPLWIAALLILLAATHASTAAWLWTIPFLLTFLGGVFADLLESRLRRAFVVLCTALLFFQAMLSLGALNAVISR